MEEPQQNPLAALEVKPGDVVGGRYEIVRLLGAGGMGSVFEARHKLLGRVVAIKVLRPEIALHPQFAGRFLQEAKAAAELSHKNIVQLTDYGLDGERPYMVMEYLHGESYGALLKREGRQSAERVVDVIDPVLRALIFAHERGVIHRDIKPDNIFLARDEEGEVTVKIVDFGIAKRQDESVQLTSAGAALGTPAYMAPEQVMASKNVTPAADQYAVGTTMFEALTRENPYLAETLNAFIVAKATQPPRELAELRPDLDPAFCAAVMKTLARNPEERFATLQQLREALSAWRSGSLQGNTVGGATAQQLRPAGLRSDPAPIAPATPTLPHGTGGAPPETIAPTQGTQQTEVLAPQGHRSTLIAVAAVAVVAVVAIAAVATSKAQPPTERVVAPTAPPTTPPPGRESRRVVFSIEATPRNATILLDGQSVGTGRAEVVRPKDGERHELLIQAEGYAQISEVLIANQDVHVSRVLIALPSTPTPPAANAHAPPRRDPNARTHRNGTQPREHSTPEQPAQPREPAQPTQPRDPPAQAQAAQPTQPAQPAQPTTPRTPRGQHATIDPNNPFGQ